MWGLQGFGLLVEELGAPSIYLSPRVLRFGMSLQQSGPSQTAPQ